MYTREMARRAIRSVPWTCGDERVVIEFAPVGPTDAESPFAPRQLEFDTGDYVQMELLGLEAHEDE